MHPVGQGRHAGLHRCPRSVRAGDDHEVASVEQRRIVMPLHDVEKRVASQDKEEPGRIVPFFVGEPPQRDRRVRRTGSAQFEVTRRERIVPLHGERCHREPVRARCLIGRRLVRRLARRHQSHCVEADRPLRRERRVEMAVMHRIERTSQDSESHHPGHAGASRWRTADHMASSNAGTPSPVAAEIG